MNKTLLIRPIITEKSMLETSNNRYTFEVPRDATKGQIKQTVEETFEVKVIKVRTIITPGKKRRVGKSRREVKKPARKKAVVELKQGQKIDVFETQG